MVTSLEAAKIATNFIKENVGAIAAGAGGLALGGVVGYAAAKRFNKKKSSKRKTKRKYSRKRSHSHNGRRKRGRYTPYTARKHKDTSHRRIRQTKNGQPYVILANGRARFISKKSAKISRKRSGGRY